MRKLLLVTALVCLLLIGGRAKHTAVMQPATEPTLADMLRTYDMQLVSPAGCYLVYEPEPQLYWVGAVVNEWAVYTELDVRVYYTPVLERALHILTFQCP